ncbi:hypothetical protein EXIGLDRAFT_720085 [Exidia glandulosa HHB12029]|uniref:F-box domain-containing protein n=1 Tax=Exidia glandulosa HHB12029 TaxID=1314781 RepID=A0A165GNA9_EXIGL|nr:hypothetical protein EXIGLDRAFT_720085 [Exidia glandulosa HHB12029]
MSIARLPAELLAIIFARLDYYDRISPSHVCRIWRSISLSFPSALWSNITSSCTVTGALREKLHRSQGVPVQLVVRPKFWLVEDTIWAVVEHLAHIESLDIHLDDDSIPSEADTAAAVSVVQALRAPAPLLTTLRINIDDNFSCEIPPPHSQSMYLPFDLFAGNAPRLRRLYIGVGFVVPSYCAALRTLTHLDCTCKDVASGVLESLDQSFPNLQTLVLSYLYCHGVLLRPSRLQLEQFELMTWDRLVVDHFGIPRIKHVGTFPYDGWFDDFSAACGDDGPGQLTGCALCFDHLHFKVWDDATGNSFYLWHIGSFSFHRDVAYPPRLWDNLQSFVVNETAIVKNEFPLLPQMQHLNVIVLDALQYYDARYPRSSTGVFVVTRDLDPIRCPALRTLTIARLDPGARVGHEVDRLDDSRVYMALACEDVANFIRTSLQFDTPRLQSLMFLGVDIIFDTESCFVALVEAADVVQVREGYYPNPIRTDV